MDDTDQTTETISRRNVLRTTAVAAGAVVAGGAAAGNVAGEVAVGTMAGGKRGGRAQLDGTVRRNAPFTLMVEGTEMRNASCHSGNSALQTYVTYSIGYCDSDDDEADGSLYMLPDEAELVPDEVYEIRAVQQCRASDLQMVALGPSNDPCGTN